MDAEDKELTGKIKEALSQQEEDYIPGAWEGFVKRRNRHKRVVLFRYASALAARLVLGWIIFGPDRIFVRKESLTPADKPLLSSADTVGPELNKTPVSAIEKISDSVKEISESKKSESVKREKIKVISKKSDVRTTENLQAVLTPYKEQDIKEALKADNSKRDSADIVRGVATGTGQKAEQVQKEVKTDDTGQTPSTHRKPALSITEERSESIKEGRKVRFGVSFAPGINATSSASSFNYSGGINLDIALTSNLEISTGIQLEHQNVVSKSGGYSSNAIPSDLKKAELVNLDIPVNITWNFHSGKAGSYYISGGISSVAYLSEKYTTTTYSQELREFALTAGAGPEEDKIYRLEQVEATSTRSVPKPDDMNIAGRINLSIGFKREITPNLTLHIEPYLKIPVTGLATEKLRFTTSGVTCKISF
ncbi:MAG: hypothetical protein PHU00_08965 [Bacteroidales bacterium]|nr:hypothetical protein [Bacteroidales bacterium]